MLRPPPTHTEIAYEELRRELGELLPVLRQLEAQAASGGPPLPGRVYTGALEYLLLHRCAQCGRDLLDGLLGFICFPSPHYAHVCPVCYFDHVAYRYDRGPRHADLTMLARRQPGLVAGALAALLDRNGMTDLVLEERLGGWLPLARLALSPMPRPESWDADLADLARWSGADAAAIAAVLAEAVSPPPPVPPTPAASDADDELAF